MQECENILLEATAVDHRYGDSTSFRQAAVVTSPASIMAQAYDRVKADGIIGSCTACIALFDGARHQLHFSNLGDSGLIVLRHIDSDVAGALRRDRRTPRTERTSDLKITFVSQQQLRSFNHPYQLGWTGAEIPEGEITSFREAREACTSSIHVRRGDIILMATDGLFDNIEMDELCALCFEWEQQNGFIRSGDIAERERRWSIGGSLADVSAKRINGLAQMLVRRAREISMDENAETPFSVLAKENDVMWSGGMPDDTTCSTFCLASLCVFVLFCGSFFLLFTDLYLVCIFNSCFAYHRCRRQCGTGTQRGVMMMMMIVYAFSCTFPHSPTW
jgi:protein phosphatase PTC7